VRAFFPDGYNAREAAMERLFSACTGYLGCRAVRGMCFVDFEDIRCATNAMLKFQGHWVREPEVAPCR